MEILTNNWGFHNGVGIAILQSHLLESDCVGNMKGESVQRIERQMSCE